MLEVGVGYGIIASISSSKGYRTVATEHPSRDYMSRMNFKMYLKEKGVFLVCNDALTGLPFAEETFDTVCLCDIVEHLAPQDIPDLLKETARVLKRKGKLILTTPNLCRLENRIRMLLGISPNPTVPVKAYGKTYDHIREYSLQEIKAFLQNHFHIEEERIEPLPVFEKRTTLPVKRILKGLGDEIYMVAYKKER